MFDTCLKCGRYSPEDGFEHREGVFVCCHCGHEHPFEERPLSVVLGAPGSGKSTLYDQAPAMPDRPAAVVLPDEYLSVLSL